MKRRSDNVKVIIVKVFVLAILALCSMGCASILNDNPNAPTATYPTDQGWPEFASL